MALTNDQITAQNFKDFYGQIRPYLNGAAHAGFTPIGTVISVMGNHAPLNYLICDGTVYNIVDYTELATYFNQEFGSINFFGGDGTTTFAVPDLRGEFLRGTGTNSHTHGGAGLAVGVHQQATLYPYIGINTQQTKTVWTHSTGVSNEGGNGIYPLNIDTQMVGYGGNDKGMDKPNGLDGAWAGATNVTNYTGRPTNTSVLYCIASKNIFMDAGNNYSTEEQVIGTWIDGKPLYQKTIQIPVSIFSSTSGSAGYYSVGVPHNISNLGVTVNIFGQAYGNVVRPVPFSYGADSPDVSYFASLGINNYGVFIECGTKFRKSVIDTNTYGAYITVQYTKTTD